MFNTLTQKQQERFKNLIDENIYCIANTLITKAMNHQLDDKDESGEDHVFDLLIMHIDENKMEGYEVNQWYIISNWLAERLKNAGAFTAELYDNYVWARFAGNQSLYFDHDLLKAVADIIEVEHLFLNDDDDS